MDSSPARWARIDAVLDEALDLPPGDRAAHVARACTGDAALEHDVRALLDADARAGRFLDAPPSAHIEALFDRGDAGDPPAADFAPGRMIGPYRLTGVIGAGGMGVVYDAERADGQFESAVALKVLRWSGAGADARRRFLRERQILAQLEHPHIARLLDGGVTDDGLPYFVMERVTPGTPLTTWCDERALDVDARLALVLQACDAVQFAHRRLVVHRDLKPSNIVVDGAGAVKLLDFGIAKLLADDDTPFATQSDARPLTPAFAAPEQVTGAPISTATDVYALGVLLYQVLTQRLPYDVATGQVADWARAVLETTPRRPSAAVTEPRRAVRLRGDLDRIVLKALEKEPARRYASVEALADDVRRHQAGLPVRAHEASTWYRARKFVGRNRLLVGGVAATVLALTAGLGATLWQARIARAEADRAAAVQRFLTSIFEQADPDREKGVELTARQILATGVARIDAEFASRPDVRTALWDVVQELQNKLGDYQAMASSTRAQVASAKAAFGPASFEYGHALRVHAMALLDLENSADAAPVLTEAMPIIRRTAGERSDEMIEALTLMGSVALGEGRRADGVQAHRQALATARDLHGPDSANAARIENDLVVAIGSSPEGLALTEHVSAIYRRVYGAESFLYGIALYNEGYQLFDAGRWAESLERYRAALAIQRKLLGDGHTKTALIYRQLARVASMQGDFDQARAMMAGAIVSLSTQFGAASMAVALAQSQLANIERMSGRFAEGIAAGRAALATVRATNESPGNRALVLSSLGATYRDWGEIRAALDAARESVAISEGPDARFLGSSLTLLGSAMVLDGQNAAAVPVLRRAIDTLRTAQQGTSAACAEALRWLADAGSGTMAAGEREAHYQEALALFARIMPAGQVDALDAQVAYATYLRDTGRTGDAAPIVDEVLAEFARAKGLQPVRLRAAQALRAELDPPR